MSDCIIDRNWSTSERKSPDAAGMWLSFSGMPEDVFESKDASSSDKGIEIGRGRGRRGRVGDVKIGAVTSVEEPSWSRDRRC